MIKKTVPICIVFIACFYISQNALAQNITAKSPDGNLEMTVNMSTKINYQVSYKDKRILDPSPISLSLKNFGSLGKDPELESIKRKEVDNVIHPVISLKNSEIRNHYNKLILNFKKNYQLVFRIYNNGLAYRFKTNIPQDNVKVTGEQIQFNFSGSDSMFFSQEKSFMTHQQGIYPHIAIESISSDKFGSIPALIDITNGPNVLVTEADLQDYPGFYLQGTGANSLKGIFPAVATKEKLESDRDYYVTERAGYIAETSGSRTFPWRVLGIFPNDRDILSNQLVYKLAEPLRLKDTSWIKPGKVAWDWWNANNIYDVDFEAGINNKTYKYYIDFASKMGLKYIILDEGWYKLGDLTKQSPNINIQELVDYGKKKDVGIILWVVWKTLDDQWNEAFDQFSRWDIKGIKVDFMQRDDQWMVNWYWKVAKEAARRKLLVNFHGSYKPTGIRRAYPNVLTREAVNGLEVNKWAKDITPTHDVTIPFTRMAVGPMDYTPGAMHNAQPKNFKAIFKRPMSQGTRVHQLAMYVIYESPMQMLADSPTHYLQAKQNIRDYLSEVPVTWDETRVLKASVGKYIVMARRKGSRWYIGGMTDEKSRDFDIDLSFLEEGIHQAQIYEDGINADRYGSDYSYAIQQLQNNDSIHIHMAKGGGWVAVID